MALTKLALIAAAVLSTFMGVSLFSSAERVPSQSLKYKKNAVPIERLQEAATAEPATAEPATGEPADPYLNLLMNSQNKAVIILVRPWYRPHTVTVVDGGKTFLVPQFGKCVKRQLCYGVPDPQEEGWLPNWRKRFVFVVPSDAEKIYINGKRQTASPGVFLYRDGALRQIGAPATKCPTQPQSVSVVFSSSTKTNGPLLLKSVTTQPPISGFSAVRMTPLETKSSKFLYGAELFIPSGAKLLRMYVSGETNLFDTTKPIKPSATGVTIHSPSGFLQYTTGESEASQKADFSADDDEEFFLVWIRFRRNTNSSWPIKIVYHDGAEAKEAYFEAVVSENQESLKNWKAELLFQEHPVHPFQATVVDSDSQYEITIPPKSALYSLDADTRELSSFDDSEKKPQ